MAESALHLELLRGGGLTVRPEEGVNAATLRYFDPAGEFALAVRAATGSQLPQPQQALASAAGDLVLAWRSPTETLLLAASAARLAQLEAQLAGAGGGCLVNLTGALTVFSVTGEDVAGLLCRLGGTACVPAAGEARRARLADVAVVTLALRPGEVRLIVERSYAPHLAGWIRETLLDETEP
jgi:heterotetrameric sarcosine oxidase gamma subunit